MKKLKYLIIAIIICIPTFVAFKSYYDTTNAPLTAKTSVKMQIDDINGNSFAYEKGKNGLSDEDFESLAKFFLNINSRAVKVEALPGSVTGQKSYCVTVSSGFREESYQYYMSTTPTLCYLVKPNGSAYQLTEADGSAFLSTKYAECLYPGAVQPVITVSNEFKLKPVSATWSFRDYKGELTEADTARFISDKTESVEVNGALSVAFDIAPDMCKVTLTDEAGTQIFDDVADKLSEAPIKEKMSVSVFVRAEWFEDPARQYCGVREYSFNATLKPATTFNTSVKEISTGRFISIVASNVDDAEKIEFASEPALSVKPKFYMDGSAAYGFLPIPLEAEAGNYTLKFKYGATEKAVELSVVPYEYTSPANIETTAEIANDALSDAAKEEFDALVNRLSVDVSSTRLYEGAFGSGVPEYCSLSRGFGRPTTVNGDESTKHFYNSVYYKSYSAVDVTAANAGKVVYVGTTHFTGKVVVIEHGYGLKTWYWGLDSTAVEVGATVATGDKLGIAGTTGLTEGELGANIAMSVGNTFVCPYDTWASGNNGVLMYGVHENKPEA